MAELGFIWIALAIVAIGSVCGRLTSYDANEEAGGGAGGSVGNLLGGDGDLGGE